MLLVTSSLRQSSVFSIDTTMIWQAMGPSSNGFSQGVSDCPVLSQYDVPEGPPPSCGFEFWGWRRAGSGAVAELRETAEVGTADRPAVQE
jgi:hypothetical protein